MTAGMTMDMEVMAAIKMTGLSIPKTGIADGCQP